MIWLNHVETEDSWGTWTSFPSANTIWLQRHLCYPLLILPRRDGGSTTGAQKHAENPKRRERGRHGMLKALWLYQPATFSWPADEIVECDRRWVYPRDKTITMSWHIWGDVWWQKTMESNVAKSSFCLEESNMKALQASHNLFVTLAVQQPIPIFLPWGAIVFLIVTIRIYWRSIVASSATALKRKRWNDMEESNQDIVVRHRRSCARSFQLTFFILVRLEQQTPGAPMIAIQHAAFESSELVDIYWMFRRIRRLWETASARGGYRIPGFASDTCRGPSPEIAVARPSPWRNGEAWTHCSPWSLTTWAEAMVCEDASNLSIPDDPSEDLLEMARHGKIW